MVTPASTPIKAPIKISNSSDFNVDCFSCKAIRRTATANDWVPAFPAVPVINEIKTANTEVSATK